jgi:hypothetical protein
MVDLVGTMALVAWPGSSFIWSAIDEDGIDLALGHV